MRGDKLQIKKVVGKIVILFAILIVLCQAFAVPIYASTVKPWKGNPWTGTPWKGNSWDGSNLQWEGTPWQGTPFSGNEWEGNGTQGEGTQGKGTEGQEWNGETWYMNPWSNNGWQGPGFQGDAWQNGGWSGNGFNGSQWGSNRTNGNQWSGNGFNGNQWSGNSSTGNQWNGSGGSGDPWSVDLPYGYEVAKYIGNDFIGGQVNMIGDFMSNPDSYRFSGSFYSNLLLNGVKLGLGDKTPWYVNGASEAQSAFANTMDGYKAAKDFAILRRGATAVTTEGRGMIAGLSKVGAISKFNVAASAIGAGYAAFETGFKGAKAYDVLTSNAKNSQKVSAVADATSSLGETILNAGVVVAAFPGGQAAGAIMIAGGAALWGVSKLTKLVADNIEFFKHPIKNTKDAIKKGWKKIKGWFS